ncbi:MAG: flagellar hook-basal body complex protein FliE [Ignavibacteria bacterium]|jgi:flagellar hook-basal body complex protein FliE
MKISGVNGFTNFIPGSQEVNKSSSTKFGNVLTDFIKDVNADQNKSKEMTKDLIEGKDVELHEVMIAGQKAQTSLDLLIEIRNKALDMFKELQKVQ